MKPPEALRALEVVDRWLQDPGSVSPEEMGAAAGAAARAAARAARAAAVAAGAAWAAARAAAGAAAEAARAAAEAARAAAGAASYRKQGEFIIEHLKNSSQTSFPSSAA